MTEIVADKTCLIFLFQARSYHRFINKSTGLFIGPSDVRRHSRILLLPEKLILLIHMAALTKTQHGTLFVYCIVFHNHTNSYFFVKIYAKSEFYS